MNGPKIYFTIPLFGGIGITQTVVCVMPMPPNNGMVK